MIIAVHNHKGGIGKTTITGHLAFRADQLGIKTLVTTLDYQGDVLRWFSEEPKLDPNKPIRLRNITALYAPEQMPPPAALHGFPLVLVDTPPEKGMADAIDPDLWVVPVDNRTAIENLASVVPKMAAKAPCYVVFYAADQGGISTLRGLQEAAQHIPKLEFHPEVIPRNPAMFRTQAYYKPVWDVPHGKGTSGHQVMIRLCDAVLERAGLIEVGN